MRRRKKKQSLHLDIAPINLIDLLLVLLIFFITTTSFLQLKVLELNLPYSSSQKASYKKNHMVVVNMDKECNIYINKELVTKVELAEKFIELKKMDKEALFQIGADRDSRHYCMVDVLDALSVAEISNISILTTNK